MLRQFGSPQIRRDDRSVVTTGTFDGVHTGHQAIVEYLVMHARQTGGVATVVSFDPHPREVLAAKPVSLLTTLAERADAFEALGLDRFVVLPFTRDLSLLEPEAYVRDVLIETVGLREIVIGYDHRFGRNRRGARARRPRAPPRALRARRTRQRLERQRPVDGDDGAHELAVGVGDQRLEDRRRVEPEGRRCGLAEGRLRSGARALLENLGGTHGFTVDVIPEQIVAGVTVSSTKARNALLNDGDAAKATELLGRPYSFAGTVVRGDQRGRTIGFPTANIQPEEARKLIPKPGVYAVWVDLEGTEQGAKQETVRYGGMMTIGYRPTFEDDEAVRIEAHLFDFEGDLYGERLRVHLIARIRDERRFDGIDAIRIQLEGDRAASHAILAG